VRHIDKWSIGLVAESDDVARVRRNLLSGFSQFVCNANISLSQATKESPRQFFDFLLEHRFHFGQASASRALDMNELFRKLSIGQLRARILHDDGLVLTVAIARCRSYSVHLSLDAASFHGIVRFLISFCYKAILGPVASTRSYLISKTFPAGHESFMQP
jgi:hypothetical protein